VEVSHVESGTGGSVVVRRSADPSLAVDLARLSENAAAIVAATPGIEIVAVTKATCGSPEVATALVRGGVQALGDSRLANLARLRSAVPGVPLWLLRAPVPEQAAEAVRLADVSLASELVSCEALAAAARARGRVHRVVVMVELGDLREGVVPSALPALLEALERLDGLVVEGLGTNFTCYGSIIPDERNLGELVRLTEAAERRIGRKLRISGGNSATLWRHLRGGGIPARIDGLRVGESILLGVDTLARRPLPGLHGDAFTLSTAIIECAVKPSLPQGESAQDAFGRRPVFVDRGLRRRAVCALGRQDAPPESLTPVDSRVEVLGASSDHLICDVEAVAPPPRVGERLSFVPGYAALVQAYTSPYVEKVYSGA
jgi:predicted amino acid racemase